jgi:hypothetical protein
MSGLPASAITFLPIDLHRWDVGPGGDVLVVPIFSDVRPINGERPASNPIKSISCIISFVFIIVEN